MVGEEFYLPDDFLIEKYNLGIDYKKRYKLVKICFREKDYDLGEIKKNSFIRYAADKKKF